MKYLQVILLMACLCSLLSAKQVVELDETNFNSRIGNQSAPSSSWIVMFSTPWCEDCQPIKSTLETLADVLPNDSEVNIATVDTTTSPNLSSYMEGEYPTILYFKDGKRYSYHGNNRVDDLLNFTNQGYSLLNGVATNFNTTMSQINDTWSQNNAADNTASQYNAAGYLYNTTANESDTTGYPYNETGYQYNATGQLYNATSQRYDTTANQPNTTGYPYNETSYQYNATDQLYNTTANQSNTTNYQYNPNGYLYNTTANQSNATGFPYNTTGNQYNASGQLYNATANQFNSANYPYNPNGYLYNTTANQFNTSGYPYNASGFPYNAPGYPYNTSAANYSWFDSIQYAQRGISPIVYFFVGVLVTSIAAMGIFLFYKLSHPSLLDKHHPNMDASSLGVLPTWQQHARPDHIHSEYYSNP